MPFFRNSFRRLSKKEGVKTADVQRILPELLGGDTDSNDAILNDTCPHADAESKVNIKKEADVETEVNVKQEDDSDSENITFLWEKRVLKDKAKLSQESNLKSDSESQVDTTNDPSILKVYTGPYSTNTSPRDDTRWSCKSETERQSFDSRFCNSVSSSENKTGNQDIPFCADERYEVIAVTSVSWLT